MNQVDVAKGAQEKLEVQALDLGKIINVLDLKIKPDDIIIEIVSLLKSGLIMPDTNGFTSVSTMKVIKVGKAVTQYEVGDIVLDFISRSNSQIDYLYKQEEGEPTARRFLLTNEYNIKIAVGADNIKE